MGNKAALDTTFEYQTTPIVATPSLTLSNPSNVLVSSGPVTYTVSYTDVEQVDLNTNEVTLNSTGTANADITVLNGDTSSVTVSLDNIVGNGSIGISIVAGTARFSTNLAPSAGPSAVFVVDTIKPSVVLSNASLNQTADFTVNMVFDESVSGFDIDDIAVVNASLSNFQTIDAKTYSVLVSATGETTIGLSVVDSAASDSAGNGNNASNSLNVIYDDLLPSVSLSGPSGTVTVGFTATIDFSEIVTDFDVNDIQVTNANLSSFTNIDGKKYTVLVSPIAQSTVSLAVDAAVAVDTFNNSNAASNSYSVIYDFNDAPVISGSPASSVNEDSGYSFIPSASDDDSGDSLSFSITNKPTWASFNSGNGQLSGTPTNADVGTTAGIVISVNDGNVTIALTAFSITVVNTNDAPVISGNPAASVNEDSGYSFTPSASDDDSGDSLSFSITKKPTWASFNGTNGQLSGTPTNADVGTTAGIVISVSDGSVTTALTAFSISVVNTNDAPVISGNPATSVNEDSGYSFTPTASDDDSGDSLSFSITNKPTWASFNSTNGQLSGTPTNSDVGTTAGIVISVNDGTVTIALTAFSIIVANTNDVPVISSIAILTAMQDQVYQYTFVVTDDDSGDVLTFYAVVKPDWLNFNTATAVLSGTPTNADVGSHIVSLKVTDSAGLSAEQSFSISVNNINDAPEITSIAVISATQDQIYNYTLVASDADIGDSLSLNALVKPSWLSFDTVTGVLSGTPTNADVGSHVVSLKVTDSAGLSAEQNFSISVNNVNDAPVISSTAITTATQDLVYNYILVANDADIGDSLSFNASVIPDWLSFDTATGILSGTPKNTDVGRHSVTLIVTDNAGLNAEQSFSIDVSNVNDAPEIMGSPLLSINEDESYIFKPDVTDADEDDSLSFIIVNKPTWAKFNGTDGTLSGIPSNDDVGVTLGIIISVSDGTIEIELPAFDIEVINVNDAPVFESEPIIEASVFAPYQYDVVVSDDDVDSSLTVAVVMAPEWLSLNSSNQLVGIPPAESADMTFEVEVSVTDAIVDLPVIQRFSLAVSQPNDTELGVNIYFSPAPAIVGQKVNLVVDIVNNGYTAALGLNYQVTFGSEFSTVVLPNECSELSAGIIDCVVADALAIGDSLSQIIELMVDNVDSGFSSANISVTATNVNNDIFERETSILLANTLSILPGKVLISVPASLGYAVDMNADNFTDLLVYIPDDLTIQIMINDGLGQLIPGVKIVLNQAVTSFTATDINVDGNIDIITTGGDIAGNRAYMLDGLFAVNSVENLDDVKADVMLISDFDFDGYSEVVLAGTYQPQVAIYSGVGSGSSTVNLVPIPFSLPSFSAAKGLQQVSTVTGVVTSSESKITALSAIATDGVIKLLVGVENQAPVLLTLDDNDWVSSAVVSLTQGTQRLINTDLDNDGKADLFVKDDNGWHLIMDAFSNDFIKSSVMFPNADDIVVTDLEADGIPELLLVMSHGVSIWHYYGSDDIRPGNYVIDAEALGTVTVLDINNDDLLDIITFDKQDGVSVWYMSAGGGVGLQDVDLALSSLMPSYPEVDRAVNITWSVFNLSDASASDVTLNVMFDTDIVLPQIPSGCALVGTILTCQLGEIAAGKSKDVTFSLRPERDGKLSLIGNVTSLEYDVNNVNNQRDASFDFASAEKSDGGSLPLWTVLLMFMFASIRANIHRYR
ncbi:putative Ig domain-containing protein [Shewanella sp. SG44-6]|uniref:putative Ig domain-containing protein n=1 Tax=Shewanella sp. SG44-6 TaxID=2760959 RepID=UPI0015FF2670|nr:putative Ig domain-containing protein [Shewanella sp. SG44-6]MBB1391433.1 putative Ig domain-containing protein [Shewanella sp. SG44-6]